MADVNKAGQPPIKPKSGFLKSPFIPLAVVVIAGGLALANQQGFITLPHISFGQSESTVFALGSTPVKVPYSHNFSSDLIPLLEAKSRVRPYTFYLGSGVGFPPTGLLLDVNGILKGTPTAAGTRTFQVCVKDGGGTSVCRSYSLTVTPKTTPVKTTTTPPPPPGPKCPTKLNPPCGSVGGGVGASGGIVPAACDCPSDSSFASMDNTAPGGPYKICVCK